MSMFGMSSAGKRARNELINTGHSLSAQAGTDYGNSADALARSNQLTNQFTGNSSDIYKKGFGSAADVVGTGKALNPGLDSAESRMTGRANQELANYTEAPSVYDTVGSTQKRLGDLYNANMDTGNNAIGQINNNRDWLLGQTDSTYKQAMERMNPEGQFMQEAAAKAGQPAIAAAMQRMRSMGIDPNSPEASSMMNDVKSRQGGYMDQAAMQALAQQNQLTLGRNAEIQGTIKGAGDQWLANNNTSMDRMGNIVGAQVGNDQTNRGLILQDVGNKNALLQNQTKQDLTNIGLNQTATGEGMNLTGANVDTRMRANAGIGQAGAQQGNQALGWNQAGTQANLGSAQVNQGVYNNEAADANWLGKGLAAAGLSWISSPWGKSNGKLGYQGGGGGGYGPAGAPPESDAYGGGYG